MDFISLSSVLDALAKVIDAPQANDESDEDMQMWRDSEAAGKLHADLHNATADDRPRWVALHKVTGFPVFDDSVADEGNEILLHIAGWYLRDKRANIAHIMDCIRANLDPTTVGPAPIDPRAGKWPSGASSFRQYQIGFDRAELSALLGDSESVLAGIPSRPEARTPDVNSSLAAIEPLADEQTDAANDPPAIPSPVIADAFSGLHNWDRETWARTLADPPKWLAGARVSKGSQRRRGAATWNPVIIAIDLYGDGDRGVKLSMLDTVFRKQGMTGWAAEWENTSSYLRDDD